MESSRSLLTTLVSPHWARGPDRQIFSFGRENASAAKFARSGEQYRWCSEAKPQRRSVNSRVTEVEKEVNETSSSWFFLVFQVRRRQGLVRLCLQSYERE